VTATWPGDELSLAVWAALGGTDLDIDQEPEQVIDRLRANNYTWQTAAEELGINPDMRPELRIASAWAGIARVALRRRDNAIRECIAAGAKYRPVAAAVSMTPAGIGRVAERQDSPRGRW
jgi:hypothetical protein